MTEETARPTPAAPSARPRRPLGLTVAAFSCWFVGTHIVVFVPIVILYMLISVCLEDGSAGILLLRPGILMLLMAALSTASTVEWMLAGWSFWRRRSRGGMVQIVVAMGLSALTAVSFAFL